MILIKRLSIPSIPGALPDGKCSITTEISRKGENGGLGGCVDVVILLLQNATQLLAVQQPTRWHHLSEALLVNGRVETALVQKPQYYKKREERRYVEAAAMWATQRKRW
ncbi:hypothetical protein AVEN_144891-1 [Araneus ventricosus]|uniref:Uncharacterized protein n=1 Tax=Araneus ventricosus TaxID=182803 RepID=A0A4Y2EDY0_ARAVE|nr:hypothetical protein AVEN_144891-1 [Araneus ventricosus]